MSRLSHYTPSFTSLLTYWGAVSGGGKELPLKDVAACEGKNSFSPKQNIKTKSQTGKQTNKQTNKTILNRVKVGFIAIFRGEQCFLLYWKLSGGGGYPL
jgi:hypothetical protein